MLHTLFKLNNIHTKTLLSELALELVNDTRGLIKIVQKDAPKSNTLHVPRIRVQ